MDCVVHGVAKSWTQLSDFHFYFSVIYVVNFTPAPSPLVPEPSSWVLRETQSQEFLEIGLT